MHIFVPQSSFKSAQKSLKVRLLNRLLFETYKIYNLLNNRRVKG
jgi:hypothetical protein